MRFGDWLRGVPTEAGYGHGPIRDGLEAAAADLVAALQGAGGDPLGGLTLSKRTLDLFGRCPGRALAHMCGEDPPATGWPVVRGRVLDALVAFRVMRGRPGDPVADAAAVLEVSDDRASAAELAGELDPHRREELDALAAATSDLEIDPAWLPRVEVSTSVRLADGMVNLPGRIDLLLGGPGTGLPAVVVEVKSAQPSVGRHAPELHHYSLLCLLRHRRAPAATALWYAPGGMTVDVRVEGAAEAAACRVEDVLGALAGIVAGADPVLRRGPQCATCPRAPACAADAEPDAEVGSEEERW